ncbi:MAG: NAD-dependent epimerase/dehydratase family protein, partial [Candidatus Marinimicrobia bacterium]|nr:NAD-dependent epimerase/dehydratase family protein [Candidatus Neomarinimicrobiota bacterium]
MKTKIMVLGSNSFSGSSFVDFSLDNDLSVVGVSRSKQPNHVFLPYYDNQNKNGSFEFYQLDINSDLDKIIDLVNQYRPEYIFNFAAQSMV